MEASKMTIDINVKDIDLFKNLVSLLEKHFDDLPSELQESLKELLENEDCDFTVDDLTDYVKLHNLNMDHTIISDDRNILKVNKHTKTIYIIDRTPQINGERKVVPEKLEHFSIKNKDHTIIEW